jgi:hypothetical protein
MKKSMRASAALFALMFVLALFAGCGGNPEDSDKNSGTAGAPTDSGGQNSGYAVGKYKVYDDGLPHEQYEYELPLSTTDEEFSWWTTCYTPQYIPDEGFGAMEYRTKMAEMTACISTMCLSTPTAWRRIFRCLWPRTLSAT